MERKLIGLALLAGPVVVLGLTSGIASAQVTSATHGRTVAIVSKPSRDVQLSGVAVPRAGADSPGPAGLSAVSCPGSSWCMAVGSYVDRSHVRHALALVWNGRTWRALRNPPGRGAQERVLLVDHVLHGAQRPGRADRGVERPDLAGGREPGARRDRAVVRQ